MIPTRVQPPSLCLLKLVELVCHRYEIWKECKWKNKNNLKYGKNENGKITMYIYIYILKDLSLFKIRLITILKRNKNS